MYTGLLNITRKKEQPRVLADMKIAACLYVFWLAQYDMKKVAAKGFG